MTDTARPAAALPPLTNVRRTARIAGWLFVATFVTSIVGLLLYDPVLNDTGYILGGGHDTQVSMGAFLEILLAIANIGTAVVLFPVLKRQSESLALAWVGSRILESTVIVVGLISLLSIVTLRQDLAGAAGVDGSALSIAGHALVAVHDWTFLIGPGFCVAVGNGMVLGYLMYRSGLVPRGMAMLGLIGGPVIFASSVAILFGAYEQSDPISFFFSIPEIAWEASLGIYMIVKGFRADSPILS
jgi:hypothetical protein